MTDREKFLRALRPGPLIAHELAKALGLKMATVNAVMLILVLANNVREDDGRYELTDRGRRIDAQTGD